MFRLSISVVLFTLCPQILLMDFYEEVFIFSGKNLNIILLLKFLCILTSCNNYILWIYRQEIFWCSVLGNKIFLK